MGTLDLYDLLERIRESLPRAGTPELAREVLLRALDHEDSVDVLCPAVLAWVSFAGQRG